MRVALILRLVCAIGVVCARGRAGAGGGPRDNTDRRRARGSPYPQRRVAGRDEHPVPPVLEQVVRRPDVIGEDERQPSCGGLVDDDAPWLVRRQECEQVRDDVPLGYPLPLDVRKKLEADTLAAGEVGEALPLRACARDDENEPRIAAARRLAPACRDPSPVRAARRRERRRRRLQARSRRETRPAAAGARRPDRRTRRRRRCPRRRRSAPGRRRARAPILARASRPPAHGRRRAPSRGRGLASRHDARLVVRLGRSTRRATRTAPAGDGTTRSRPAKRTCSSPTPRRPPGRSCPARRRRRRRWGSRAGGRDRRPESGAPLAPRRDGRAREPTLGAGPTLPHTPPSGRPRAGRPDVRASGCDRASAREAPS